ncbi:hypothetical protein [Paenibacillus protaetiae]|uniref:Uncharacterized protein n=1 Tax=Paenibacillus protaetiae TaxID=2509456 RepID=A0A4P6EYR5_9BACL|nr:hypothetical protein [Paenibacillus protaetiae]QAY65817.1 hypothetical protein ET464_04885 [Paenibacillus protaetiae]
MAVIFKLVGGTAIFSADAEVRTKDGWLEVSFVETQRIPGGNLDGVMQISLNGKPLVVASSSVKPKSGANKSKYVRKQFQVYGSDKLNELSEPLVFAFGRLKKELAEFDKNKPEMMLRLPCFLRIPLCRLAYSQYIVACRLRGRPAVECLQEAEGIYNNCKGNC